MARKVRTTPRKTPRQERSRATVDAILSATARLLVNRGFDRTTTNQVAADAGVSVGSLYQYFPSKEALVGALMERHVEEMNAAIFVELDRVRGQPLPDVARAMVQLMIRAHAVDPDLHRVFMEQVPRTGRMARLRTFEQTVYQAIVAFLRAREDEIVVDDVELAAFMIVASVEAITHGAVLYQPERLRDDRLVDELSALIVRYLTGGVAVRARAA
jgi:AcrR family transcriptional regulator